MKKDKEFLFYAGVEYMNEQELCESHGLSYADYKKERKSGKSLAECMSDFWKDTQFRYAVVDPNGIYFKNTAMMCAHHGVAYTRFCDRKREGRSLEECLTPGKLGRRYFRKPLTEAGTVAKTKKGNVKSNVSKNGEEVVGIICVNAEQFEEKGTDVTKFGKFLNKESILTLLMSYSAEEVAKILEITQMDLNVVLLGK